MAETWDQAELIRTAHRRLNVGCGEYAFAGWTNLDSSPDLYAEVHAEVPPLPYEDETLDHIYAGHFLEHLDYSDATLFLSECYRCLTPGGRLGVVVPDTREIMQRWLGNAIDRVEGPPNAWHPVNDLDSVCRLFLYSDIQESGHLWSWELATLGRAMAAAGFVDLAEIDRYDDPRIMFGAWYQCGIDGWKVPGRLDKQQEGGK